MRDDAPASVEVRRQAGNVVGVDIEHLHATWLDRTRELVKTDVPEHECVIFRHGVTVVTVRGRCQATLTVAIRLPADKRDALAMISVGGSAVNQMTKRLPDECR